MNLKISHELPPIGVYLLLKHCRNSDHILQIIMKLISLSNAQTVIDYELFETQNEVVHLFRL